MSARTHKLTVKELKAMKDDVIFASGIGLIEHPWFNNCTKVSEGGALEKDGRHTKIKWIAIRGNGYYDWAIYHSMDENLCKTDYFNDIEHLNIDEDTIARHGAKLHNERKIREFINCDNKAFELYRH